MKNRTRVFILGGGYSAVASAFELTATPELRKRFDVTMLVDDSWLGGRAASWTTPVALPGLAGDRVEERSPHLWLGCYESAFQLMRRCYAELTGNDTVWRDAFDTASVVAVPTKATSQKLDFWQFDLPTAPGTPGEPEGNREQRSIGDYLNVLWAFWRTALTSLDVIPVKSIALSSTASPISVMDSVAALLRQAEPMFLGCVIHSIEWMRSLLVPRLDDQLSRGALRTFVNSDHLRDRLASVLRGTPARERIWQLTDVSLAITRGLIKLELERQPLSSIDDQDCSDWLVSNGASRQSVDTEFMRAMYGMGMSFADGDSGSPRMAAGQAIFAFLRTLSYRGEYVWQFSRGPGQDFFAPMEHVLGRRGVKIRYGHQVTRLRFSRHTRPFLESIEMLCAPEGDGRSVSVRGRGRSVRASFKTDFDVAVVSFPVGVMLKVAPDLFSSDPHWHEMGRRTGLASTQGFQLWLKVPMRDLGMPGPPIIATGYTGQFDTFADMRHRLAMENWRTKSPGRATRGGFVTPPRALAVFRGMVASHFGSLTQAQARRNAVDFLENEVALFWPEAIDRRGKFRWELTLGGAPNAQSLFAWSGTAPKHKVTQTLPGTTHLRISPSSDAIPNMRVCGDGTLSGFHTSTAECAVMSGRQAAFSISGGAPEIPGMIPESSLFLKQL